MVTNDLFGQAKVASLAKRLRHWADHFSQLGQMLLDWNTGSQFVFVAPVTMTHALYVDEHVWFVSAL
jgi:hypothetical protein